MSPRHSPGWCVHIRRHAESGHEATERCELLSDSAGGVVYPPRRARIGGQVINPVRVAKSLLSMVYGDALLQF